MNGTRNSLQRLLRLAACGDVPAREGLLDHYRDRLRRIVAHRLDQRVAPRCDPSDVVQETLLVADRRLDAYLADRPLPFLAWLRQIARDRIADTHRRHLRSQRRSVAREDAAPASIGGYTDELAWSLVGVITSPGSRLSRQERLEQVSKAMAVLSPRDRDLLTRRHIEQLSAAEIAAALGISRGAAEVGLYRALVRLKEQLEVAP